MADIRLPVAKADLPATLSLILSATKNIGTDDSHEDVIGFRTLSEDAPCGDGFLEAAILALGLQLPGNIHIFGVLIPQTANESAIRPQRLKAVKSKKAELKSVISQSGLHLVRAVGTGYAYSKFTESRDKPIEGAITFSKSTTNITAAAVGGVLLTNVWKFTLPATMVMRVSRSSTAWMELTPLETRLNGTIRRFSTVDDAVENIAMCAMDYGTLDDAAHVLRVPANTYTLGAILLESDGDDTLIPFQGDISLAVCAFQPENTKYVLVVALKRSLYKLFAELRCGSHPGAAGQMDFVMRPAHIIPPTTPLLLLAAHSIPGVPVEKISSFEKLRRSAEEFTEAITQPFDDEETELPNAAAATDINNSSVSVTSEPAQKPYWPLMVAMAFGVLAVVINFWLVVKSRREQYEEEFEP